MNSIERFSIPSPFDIGPVNCYFLSQDSPSLIDPGPATAEAYESLVNQITQLGYDISDIENVLITHPHLDHFGLVQQIADETDAHVFAHENAAPKLADPLGFFRQRQEYFRELYSSMGVPTDKINTAVELTESTVPYRQPVNVTDELRDGDTLDVGTELEAINTPGHSPGSLCYLAGSIMFTGDHVLPETTPNPFITLAPGSKSQRTRSLPAYLDSLEKVLEYNVSIGYGGHGEPIEDLHARVRETIAHHEQRKQQMSSTIEDEEPVTAYEILKIMFPDITTSEILSGMSEVVGHLDLLENEQRIKIRDQEGVTRYMLRRNDT